MNTPVVPSAARTFPMSFAQKGLWFLHLLEGPSATYNVPLAVRVRGDIDVPALELALADVRERHESLRTVLCEVEERPCQRIVPAEEAGRVLSVLDSDHDRLQTDVLTAASRPFDLTVDLPLRAFLLRVAPREQVLVLVMHHVACDGWSLRPLLRDLGSAYAERLRGRAPQWEPLPVQYSDYTLWQRELLGREEDCDSLGNRQLAYWRVALADLPEELPLPFDRVPAAVGVVATGATVERRLPFQLHTALLDLASQHGCTLFMVLQAAVAVVLTRWGAGTDIPFGTPVAGRTDEALDDLVGYFVNTVVLRIDTSGNPPFAELLERVRAMSLEAYAHQDLPFDRVVEALNPRRSPTRHPLFQVMLALKETTPDEALVLSKAEVAPFPLALDISKFSLTLDFEDLRETDGSPAGLGLALEYVTDLFDAETIEALAERVHQVLQEVAAAPDARIRELPVLPPAERNRQLSAWNGPACTEQRLDIGRRLRRWAEDRPDAVAVSDNGTRYTYGRLLQATDRVARRLRASGAGPESLTAVLSDRTAWFVATVLGVLCSGSGYLALDGGLPVARVRRMLTDAPVHYLVVASELRARGSEVAADDAVTVVPLDVVAHEENGGGWSEQDIDPGALAYAVFTSGSTGRPKSVLIPRRGLANHLHAVADLYGLDATDTMAFNAPLTFDVSVWQALTMPFVGGRVHVLDDDTTRDPLALARCTADEGITVLQIVPQVLRAVLDMWDQDPSSVPLLAGLRWMLVHGEELPPDLVDRWFARHPDIPLANVYGPAECSDDVSISVISAEDDYRRERAPIGQLLRNMRAFVLDEYLQLLPVGAVGELYVGGAGLARGYASRPATTARCFVANPFGAPGERMYRTGDLVRWNQQGELEFLGRVDQQVKIRGFRIEPGEVQGAVEAEPGVRQAFILAREDAHAGKRLVAYVVAADGVTVDCDDLRHRVRRILPEHMVPSVFVLVDELPTTPNGKLDGKALPEPPAARRSAGVSPCTPQEVVLCGLFAEVLGLPEVGVDEDFFELGGHSLLAMRLLSRIRAVAGVQIGVRALLDDPTVSGVLTAVGGDTGEAYDVMLPLRAGVGTRPLFCVHPATGLAWSYVGLATHLPADLPVYGIQAPGLREGTRAPRSMTEMLDRLLAEIRDVQPLGPYRLLGWSLGGNIAHALAARLEAAGEQVELLVLVDSYPGETWPYPPSVTRAQWDEYSLLVSLVPAVLPADDVEAALERMRDAARERLAMAPEEFRRLVAVGVNAAALVAAYRPGRVVTRTLQFTATEGQTERRPDPQSWAPYVVAPSHHSLHCRHEEAMDAVPRKHIAEVVGAYLSAADDPARRPDGKAGSTR
jgi:nonribosomal peptide synthetase DhbF